jgi:hypothetical protein
MFLAERIFEYLTELDQPRIEGKKTGGGSPWWQSFRLG